VQGEGFSEGSNVRGKHARRVTGIQRYKELLRGVNFTVQGARGKVGKRNPFLQSQLGTRWDVPWVGRGGELKLGENVSEKRLFILWKEEAVHHSQAFICEVVEGRKEGSRDRRWGE